MYFFLAVGFGAPYGVWLYRKRHASQEESDLTFENVTRSNTEAPGEGNTRPNTEAPGEGNTRLNTEVPGERNTRPHTEASGNTVSDTLPCILANVTDLFR